MGQERQPLLQHLSELGYRMIAPLVMLGLGAGLGFWQNNVIIGWLSQPLSMPLYYSAPSGGFEFILKVSLLVGLILALPTLVYNIIRFVEPAWGRRRVRRRTMLGVVAISCLLAVGGMAFAYVTILPASLHFFSTFGGTTVQPLISATAYFSFVLGCLAAFAVIFQLPLILLFVNTIRRWPPHSLSRYHRHVIVGSFVVGLLLPFAYDPITQLLLALPIIGLYEVSVGLVWLVNRRYRRREALAVVKPAQLEVPAEATPAANEPVIAPVTPTPPKPPSIDRPRRIQLG